MSGFAAHPGGGLVTGGGFLGEQTLRTSGAPTCKTAVAITSGAAHPPDVYTAERFWDGEPHPPPAPG